MKYALIIACLCVAGCTAPISPGVYRIDGQPGSEVVIRSDRTGEFRVEYTGGGSITPFRWNVRHGELHYDNLPSDAPPQPHRQKIRNITPHSCEIYSIVGTDENLEKQWGWVKWTLQSDKGLANKASEDIGAMRRDESERSKRAHGSQTDS